MQPHVLLRERSRGRFVTEEIQCDKRRQKYEDAMRLALKREEGATKPGLQGTQLQELVKARKRVLPESCGEEQRGPHLDVSPETHCRPPDCTEINVLF